MRRQASGMEGMSTERQGNSEAEDVVWTYEKEDLLAVLWEQRPCLYPGNLAQECLSVRNTKIMDAYREIAKELGMTAQQVQQRIRTMKAQFVKLKKIYLRENGKKTRRFQWFEEKAPFLNNYVDEKTITSNLVASSSNGCEEESNSNITDGTDKTAKTSRIPMQQNRDAENVEHQSFGDVSNSPMPQQSRPSIQPSDSCSRFGEYVTESLRQMDEKTRFLAINNIQNAIFQAQMSVYDFSSDSFQKLPLSSEEQAF